MSRGVAASTACAHNPSHLRALAALAVVAAWVLCAAPALAQPAVEGRAQARKAGQLAAQGKCGPAVQAYTRAFQILGDPAILFNRAECLRKLGRLEQALADYERFLVEMPKAPNKPLVEQRIEGLRERLNMSAAGTSVAAKPSRSGKAGRSRLEPAPHADAPTAAIIDDEPIDEEEELPAPAPVPDWKPPGATDTADLTASADDRDEGVSPWVWAGLGAVVVAAAFVAGFFVLRKNDTDAPESLLGNYQF